MKKSILSVAALATLLLLTGTASADRLGGDWALEFQVRPTFLGYRDPGVGIAAKYHFTHRSAVRAGFTWSASSADEKDTQSDSESTIYNSSSASVSGTDNQERRNVSVFAHFVRDLGIGNRIAVFLEGGPLVRRNMTADSRIQTFSQSPNVETQTRYYDSESWDYGAEAQGGFEWFVKNRLSIAARYGAWALWTRGEHHESYVDTYPTAQRIINVDSTTHAFSIGTAAATFSVIAYW